MSSPIHGPLVEYLLRPPENQEKQALVRVVRGIHDEATVTLLDPWKANPYAPYSEMQDRDYVLQPPDKKTDILDELIEIASSIEMHGISIEQDQFTVVRNTKGARPESLQRLLEKLPFSGNAPESPADALDQQYYAGRSRHTELAEAHEVLAQQKQIP